MSAPEKPTYKPFPATLYVVRKKGTKTYRCGTKQRVIPKLYKHNPGLGPDEELCPIADPHIVICDPV